MMTASWAIGHGVELIDAPDALLGRGQSGVVHLGRRRGDVVAVKIMEGQTATRTLPPPLVHPNLVQVVDRFASAGRWAEVRSLCTGGELCDRIAEEGALLPEEAIHLFAQVASGVAHSHSCGIAHGQLRPEHVLLSDEDNIQLLGFVQAIAAPLVTLRSVRPLDAPEWHAGGGVSTCPGSQLPAADVWAMCLLLLFMLSGAPPFVSGNPALCPRARFAPFRADLPLAGCCHGWHCCGCFNGGYEVAALSWRLCSSCSARTAAMRSAMIAGLDLLLWLLPRLPLQ